ncbi:transglutaminase domain-containing protein [Methanobrevibacter sp.]|uniref:transglutaminase domain-containing protein n=1 Tax=Methanobrevibacter sp. TaxID=66852 RepID=UPI003863C96D
MSIFVILFLIVGAVSATDSINVSNAEDSNLMYDNVDALSTQNKLEISNEVSISQTNIVYSHDDNLGSSDVSLNDSDIETEGEYALGSTSSGDSVLTEDASNDIVSADSSSIKSVSQSTKLNVSDTHYEASVTHFNVTLKDMDDKAVPNQKISLEVGGKIYSAITDSEGMAYVETHKLAQGSYTVSLSYAGDSSYAASSLSKNVDVLSSITGSNFTKYYLDSSNYNVTFWRGNSPLANTNVTFILNGKTYVKTTDDDGVVTLDVNWPVGKYGLTAINPYSGEEVTHKIVVKKDKTKFKAKSKIKVKANKKTSFSVVLKSKHGALLKNKKIYFTYDNKKVTAKTNSKGKATVTIPVLSKGTHKISFKYKGEKGFYSKSGSATLVVSGSSKKTTDSTKTSSSATSQSSTKLSSSVLVMKYNSGSKFKVKLTNDQGKALGHKKIKFVIGSHTKISKTNGKGIAKLSLKNVKPGSHVVKYSYSKKGSKDYSHGSNRAIILKATVSISAHNLVMNENDNSSYTVAVKDKSGKPLSGVTVKSTIGSKSYIYQTDSEGVAKLAITKGTGYYSIKTFVSDKCYKSKSVSKHVLVNGTKLVSKSVYASAGDEASYSVKLVDGKNKPVEDKDVVFTFNNKNSTVKTDSKGVAKINLGVLPKGTHKIEFSHGSTHGSSNVYVVNKVSVKNILTASKKVKKYISKHRKLPSSVKIGNAKFKTADYLYLASKAIVNLKSGNKKDIPVKIIKNPSKAKKATNLGYLKSFVGVAKFIVKTAESKGKMPNSVSSKVGSIGYQGVVSTLTKVLVYYGGHKKMPSYVSVNSLSGSSSSSSTGVLNSKNKISNLAAYLAASTNCEVNNAQIKKLVSKLTKNCKSDKEKADKIFRYVRDTISYSFYYDTKYGAVGTLNAGSGNCVDHSHLLVAMFRSAGLAARYVHGVCTFSSGGTYGHVWSQVLIGDTWVVADATSSRNSFGSVANWNSHSYHLNGYYASLQF